MTPLWWSSPRILLVATAIWFGGDLIHTLWHVDNGDTWTTFVEEMLIDVILAALALSALWLPNRLRRPVGGTLAILLAAFSLARGVSGSLSSEGSVWVHVMLGLSGVPLLACGIAQLRRPHAPSHTAAPVPR
jgi:hypothetical protein